MIDRIQVPGRVSPSEYWHEVWCGKLEWCGYPIVKEVRGYDRAYTRFDTNVTDRPRDGVDSACSLGAVARQQSLVAYIELDD